MARLHYIVCFTVQLGILFARDIPKLDVRDASRTFYDPDEPPVMYYRYLMVDERHDAMYVGAMERVYRLNAYDVTSVNDNYKKSPALPPREDDVLGCSTTAHVDSNIDCRNHIRLLVRKGTNAIYGCGTGSYYPLEFELNLSDLTAQSPYPPMMRGTATKICPYTLDGSYAAINVITGNPNGVEALYAATDTPISSLKQVWNRPTLSSGVPELKTLDTSLSQRNKWLNDASFVATFEFGEYVYLFFNEIALESGSGNNVARVARVCKNDAGGKVYFQLNGRWTSFVKVRLSCSNPGVEAFHFNQLRDVRRVDGVYYGLFTTPNNDLSSSALCRYTQQEVDAAFEGTFYEYSDTDGWFEQTEIPSPRPGTCNTDSQSIPIPTENFILSHPLLFHPLSPQGNRPLLTLPLEQAYKLLVQRAIGKNSAAYIVLFLMMKGRSAEKIAYDVASAQMKRIASLTAFDEDVTVRAALHHNSNLYFTTDSMVKQISVYQCSGYALCVECVQDPHCGWHQLSASCKAFQSGMFQDVMGDGLSECGAAGACFQTASALPEVRSVRVPGDALHLPCDSVCVHDDDTVSRTWYRDGLPLTIRDGARYLMTSHAGLILLNTTQRDEGKYECYASSTLLATFSVQVPPCKTFDEDCIWKEEFRNWCSAFDNYRNEYNSWLCAKDECFNNNNCEPSALSQCRAPIL